MLVWPGSTLEVVTAASADPLASFDETVRVFRETSYHVHGPLVSEDLPDHTLRARAGETARDVYVSCEALRELYGRALAELRVQLRRFEVEVAARPAADASREEWERHGEWWSDVTREDSLREFSERLEGRDATSAFTVAFKAVYFFIRAHKDALCGFAVLLLQPRCTDPTEYNMRRT
jgi:hypothetical protein